MSRKPYAQAYFHREFNSWAVAVWQDPARVGAADSFHTCPDEETAQKEADQINFINRGASPRQIMNEVKLQPPINGWRYFIEAMMGSGYYVHPRSKISIYATPDWEDSDTLDIQVMDDRGHVLGGVSLPFAGAERTLERFLSLVRPYLDQHQPPETP